MLLYLNVSQMHISLFIYLVYHLRVILVFNSDDIIILVITKLQNRYTTTKIEE